MGRWFSGVCWTRLQLASEWWRMSQLTIPTPRSPCKTCTFKSPLDTYMIDHFLPSHVDFIWFPDRSMQAKLSQLLTFLYMSHVIEIVVALAQRWHPASAWASAQNLVTNNLRHKHSTIPKRTKSNRTNSWNAKAQSQQKRVDVLSSWYSCTNIHYVYIYIISLVKKNK